MKQQLITNVSRLTEWAAFCGHKDPRQWLADEIGCSKSWVNQLFCGAVPGAIKRLRICKATGINGDELFLVSKQEKSA